MTAISTESTTIDLTDLNPYEDVDDGKDHKTHIINVEKNEHLGFGDDPQMMVDTARFLEVEIEALCGYKWIPKRNPEKYPVCMECMKIAEQYMREAGE